MNIDQLSAPIIAGKPPSQETNPLLQGIHESGNNSKVSIADLTAVMQSQGLPSSAQSQIMTAVMGSQPPAGSTVDMASVLAKIQALEKEKVDLVKHPPLPSLLPPSSSFQSMPLKEAD